MSASSSVHAARGELAAHEAEHLAAAPRDLVGRVHVGEAREAARAEVAVGRVDDELHRRRHRLVACSARPSRARPPRAPRLGGEPLLDQPIDEREQRAECDRARGRCGTARISDGYRLATSALTTRCATPAANRCSAAPCAAVPSPGCVRGQRARRAQVRAHQQRIDHAGRGAGVGEPLVATRRHARERERRAAEQARERPRPRRRRAVA